MFIKLVNLYRPDSKSLPQLEPGDRLLLSPSQIPEPCLENTKCNTPELERKNMLGKIKDMKEKGREFMHRITTNDPLDDRSMVELKNRPDKNLFFTGDELKGKYHILKGNISKR